MAGHNKWSKIKHRKAVVDKRRGKVWTKVSKAIIVAARHGGPDPASNLALRYAIDEARYANMPRDTIERAIKKGAGGEDTAHGGLLGFAQTQQLEGRLLGCGLGGFDEAVEAALDDRRRWSREARARQRGVILGRR